MKVTITVNNVWSRISGLKNIKLVDELDRYTSYYVEGYQFTRAFKQGFYDRKSGTFKLWDGKKHLLTSRMVFPTGLLNRIIDFLCNKKVEYQIIDKRGKIKLGRKIKIKGYKPRYYQEEAVQAALDNGRGMLRMGTGSGKTLTIAMIAAKYNVPTMIYVIGKDLLYQFHDTFTKSLGTEIGLIGDGKCEIKKINICSVWTACKSFGLKTKISLDDEDWAPEILLINDKKKLEIKKAVENSHLTIFDEAHYLATDSMQAIYKASKNSRYIFGLSGTCFRDDGADLLLESVCGQRIYDLPSSELIESGFLAQPKITMLEVPKYTNKIKSHYQTIYSKYIINNEDRNNLILGSAEKLVEKGRKVLILVKNISHGKLLSKNLNIPHYFVNGSVDSQTRIKVKDRIESGEYKVLIASAVFDIGIDIPCLDGLVLAGGGKSAVRALQRIGRVIRKYKNKNNAIIVDFIDNEKYVTKHSAIRIAVYMTEPKFVIKFPKNFNVDEIKIPKRIKKVVR